MTEKKANVIWGEKMACYVAYMRWQGCSAMEIAEKLDITRQQVHLHLKKIPFPNPDAQRFPRPAMSDDEAKAVISYFVSSKDISISQVAAETGLSASSIKMFCNHVRGAHSAYRSEGYPAIADWLNREGVTLNYFQKLVGYTRLASYLFSPFPYKEMPEQQAKDIAKVIGVPVKELMQVASAAQKVANGTSSVNDYETIISAVRVGNAISTRPRRKAYPQRTRRVSANGACDVTVDAIPELVGGGSHRE